MVQNALQRTVAIDRETTFGEGIADWTSLSANGSMLYIINPNVDGLVQAMLEDENVRRRAAAEKDMFLGLKSEASFSFEMYQYGDPNPSATAGQQGDRLGRDDILLNALGGESIGYATTLTGGGTTNAPEIAESNFDSQDPYAIAFFYDVDEARGYFRMFFGITDGGPGVDDTITMAPGHTLPFTPAASDPVYACVTHFPDWDILEDHSNASHISNTMLLYGRHAEDVYEPRGIAFSVNIGPIEAGSAVKWTVNAKAATFVEVEDNTQPALTGTPSGQHGPVVGSGQATLCSMGDYGGALSTQQFQGQITVNLGIERMGDMGPNGFEGVHGWSISEASYSATTVELTVPFDADWFTDFRSGTNKQLLIQIGDQPALAHGIYFPRLAWAAEPVRVNNNGLTSLKLSFKAREGFSENSTTVAITNNRARAKFYVFRVANALA